MGVPSEKYKKLASEMAALTKSECGGLGCRNIGAGKCCTPGDCMVTMITAQDLFGVDLGPRGTLVNGERVFNAAGECVLEPWERPLCTMHTCEISSMGSKITDPEWTKKYFELRGAMDLQLARDTEGEPC